MRRDVDEGGGGGGIMKVRARQMSAGEHSAPVVEEPPQRAATPSHSAKQMGRDPDTGPMMLNIKGYFDRLSAVGVRSNTMVSGDLCGASPWCGGGKMCPTLFRNYLRTGASTRRGLCTHAQLAEAWHTDPEIGVLLSAEKIFLRDVN